MNLQIISTDLLNSYLKQFPEDFSKAFETLQEAEISTENFSFYTSVSSVYSSKIEGEEIELDSYIKHKKFGVEFLPDYTRKIDDLYDAYLFAQQNNLKGVKNSEVHKILSKNIVSPNFQGKLRIQNMYVSTPEGKIEYVAASPFDLKTEMNKFYSDLETLLDSNLSFEETFYFASMIHLVFVKIHPWNDGNGRTARLLEKWFIAQILGEKAWYLQSEKMYYNNHQEYYNNLRKLGLEYETLDYSKALPFLLMLPKSI